MWEALSERRHEGFQGESLTYLRQGFLLRAERYGGQAGGQAPPRRGCGVFHPQTPDQKEAAASLWTPSVQVAGSGSRALRNRRPFRAESV